VAKYDLTLALQESGAEISGGLEYASDIFAADLTPGRWGLVDFFIGPEGSHAAKGMAAEFRVR